MVDSNRNMTSRAGRNFNLMKATTISNPANKKITMFISPGTPLASSNKGSTITVEGIIKEHSMYKGVRSTVLSNATIVPAGLHLPQLMLEVPEIQFPKPSPLME